MPYASRPDRRVLAQLVCALLLYGTAAATAVTVAAGAAPAETAAPAASSPLPPLVDPATMQHHAGKVIWLDLVTPDLDGSKRFYAGLFGWSFRDAQVGGRDYTTAWLQGRPVAGLIQRAPPPGPRRRPVWLSFLSVSDVDAARRVALSHGARLLTDIHDYPRRGRQAIFADPEGAVFAVLASSAGDPDDDLADPGEWIWSALFARDPDQEAAFYQAVFGYDVFDVDDSAGSDGASHGGASSNGAGGDRTDHLILSSDDYARASVNQLSGARKRHTPHWLNFVRVSDVSATAARAITLGGRVLVQPRVDRQGGKLAVIIDPNGAPLGLMEWSGAAGNAAGGIGAPAAPGGGGPQ